MNNAVRQQVMFCAFAFHEKNLYCNFQQELVNFINTFSILKNETIT